MPTQSLGSPWRCGSLGRCGSVLVLVRWGRDRHRSFRRHPHVGIAHIAETVAAECGVLEPDFRNRYEEKPTYSSVQFPSSSRASATRASRPVAAPPRERQPDALASRRGSGREQALRRLVQARQSGTVGRSRRGFNGQPPGRCALVASCETDVINDAETCIRVGTCTRRQRGRRDWLS
jgi:hypothetical protein